MVDANSLIEGHCKFRDGKKWKTRWAVVTKLSPVADCLQLQIYRDEKERARNGHTKASLSLQAFLALESGFTLDKESHTLAIICQDLCVVLAFDNRERLIQWTVRIANNLGEGQQFLVQLASAPAKSKLTPGPVKLHITDRKFCLTGGIPPRLLGHWEVPHLRRYGLVEGRLVFEGGSRCGKGEGVHVLVPDPPQISLIIDALDMSSKGQLVRGPSRRFGSGVTDSPRKSLSRLSELRSSSSVGHASQEPLSITPVPIPAANLAISATMSPTPRESRSAEALCNACGDNGIIGVGQPTPSGGSSSMWMSSEASSRCDLDSCDNVSVISPEEAVTNENHGHMKHPASPAKTLAQSQPLQIAKPMPSAMERCLSCMSKLGQQGQDNILSPSWTMDLTVSATSASSTNGVTPLLNNGSNNLSSGNSDRLSISSHGSSGGVTEYYYDTPRSVLVAEARRSAAARASTPPGVFQNGQQQQMMHVSTSGNGCSTNSHYSGGSNGSGGGCSSPYRNPRNGIHGCTNGFTPSVAGQQQGALCPTGCHCHNHPPRVMNSSSTASGAAGHIGNSPIYYNGVAEQNAHGGKPPINLHSSSGSNSGAGPYENYDFPRCTHPTSFPSSNHSSSCGCCSGEHSSCGGHSGGIDWNKKPAMDRSSVASTAVASDPTSEFYDTPPRHTSCSCCSVPPSCPCCTGPGSSAASHLHHSHGHSHYQNPACLMDPMENYDVPPSHPHGSGGIQSQPKDLQQCGIPARSVNGEGKMPLVSGNALPPRAANAHAIYAQVDKTKKTPRPLPHFVNCDNNHHQQPIYENHGNAHCQQHQQQLIMQQQQQQPTYANVECKAHSKGKPPAPVPEQSAAPATTQVHTVPNKVVNHQQGSNNPTSNYVNLEFADSLLLYENAQEIRQEPVGAANPPPQPEEKCASLVTASSSEDTQQNPKSCNEETKKECKDELKSIPEGVEGETKENDYENTRALVSEEGKAKEEAKSKTPCNSSSSSEPSNVKEESPSAIPSSDTTTPSDMSQAGTSKNTNSGNKGAEEEPGLPLRRSSSVPCKGGHANRGSASSSDSGVSGDGGLFFDDSSPLNDIGSLCLHESLPRKTQRGSPGASAKGTSTTCTPKPLDQPEERQVADGGAGESVDGNATTDPLLLNRHYETIDESKGNCQSATAAAAPATLTHQPITNPTVAAMKSGEICSVQRGKNSTTLVSDANSTSSGASDMSDYIETLSSCSRGSIDTVTSIPVNSMVGSNSMNISVSPRKSSNMKPRSGKEYFKIDRSMFKND